MTRPPIPPMAEGWAAHPYAPRSTAQTLRAVEFRRYAVPAGTAPASCPHCQATVYRLAGDPAWTDETGTTHADAGYRVDCEPDVAGVPPTADAPGSGILHTMLCDIPRPLPETADAQSAPMADRTGTKPRGR